MARLVRRAWPGTVRELFHEVERLCVLCEGELDQPELVREPVLDTAGGAGGVALGGAGGVRTLAELEREAIERALELSGGDKTLAAQRLGISRAKIYQRLKDWREGRA
jgi:DNA-binding NtrC family response regulator